MSKKLQDVLGAMFPRAPGDANEFARIQDDGAAVAVLGMLAGDVDGTDDERNEQEGAAAEGAGGAAASAAAAADGAREQAQAQRQGGDFAEFILAEHKFPDGHKYYLTTWAGWPITASTWQRRSQMRVEAPDVVEDFKFEDGKITLRLERKCIVPFAVLDPHRGCWYDCSYDEGVTHDKVYKVINDHCTEGKAVAPTTIKLKSGVDVRLDVPVRAEQTIDEAVYRWVVMYRSG